MNGAFAFHPAPASSTLLVIAALFFPILEARSQARVEPLNVPSGGQAGFSRLASSSTGIQFTNRLAGDLFFASFDLHNGSGLAAGDVNGDGWCDLYFCALQGPNQLYLNRGSWRFELASNLNGAACPDALSTGAALADVDGDGDLDLLVNQFGAGTRLFFNDGGGRFSECLDCGLAERFSATSMALADAEGDGDLDLYVANYRTDALRDAPNARVTVKPVDGRLTVTHVNGQPADLPPWSGRIQVGPNGELIELGEPDLYYLNDGTGKFQAIPFTDGAFLDEEDRPVAAPRDYGLAVQFRDLNGDLAPDLYICNDNDSVDRIWINDGAGRFRAIPRTAVRHTSRSSMGVDVADFNRDGYDDIFVVDMLARSHAKRQAQLHRDLPESTGIGEIENRPRFPRNTLFLNRGGGTYAEIAFLAGLHASDWSWCPVFLDVDLDGYEDLLISTGFALDILDSDSQERIDAMKRSARNGDMRLLRRHHPPFRTASAAFRNRGDLTFEEASAAWGFVEPGIAHGMALADLDNDGDLDAAFNQLNEEAGIYRNNSSAPRLKVRLRGQAPNTAGVGAKITVLGGPVRQSQEIICGGRYMSGDEMVRTFAGEVGAEPLTVRVQWRSGARSEWRGKPNQNVLLVEPGPGEPAVNPMPTISSRPWFRDARAKLNHLHHENLFDDSARQPSLPRRLSQAGPGLAWFDLNQDGWEDLIIGSGKGGRLAAYLNDQLGGFSAWTNGVFSKGLTRDQSGVAVEWEPGSGARILAGSSNYEDGLAAGPVGRIFAFQSGQIDESLPSSSSSTGPLAMADVDLDGDLDLFVGGRAAPGRYPEPARSMLLIREGRQFHADERNRELHAALALVNGAVFSDLDEDGDPDLIWACDWGPVRLWRNENGVFSEVTRPSGLSPYIGWWNGVATGDFDEDGDLDIVAANWGRNTVFEPFRHHPLRAHFADLDGNGMVELVESYWDRETRRWVPFRDKLGLSLVLPNVLERFATHTAYARADLRSVLGEAYDQMRVLEATTLESMVFLNQGGRFQARPLPMPAQFAPAFSVCVGDGDGDGHEDLFLSQNFSAFPPVVGRYDAGEGLWLRGNGRGDFEAVPGHRSGLLVHGEQRGAALADFDRDGRVDWVVAQNGAPTRLFQNVAAEPGLRVRLIGAPGNPFAVGASIRLVYAGRRGPAREIQAGSGYWSQNSFVHVLGKSDPAEALWVRWPGGRETMTPLPSAALEITISEDGTSKTR